MALPTFVGIGPGRSGTSWLYEMLSAHPGVAMARGTKETEFFGGEFNRGREWYESFFDASCAVRGEISQRYIFDERVPARMAELVPGVRIIVTLRAPLERMISVYNYRKRVGTYKVPLAEALRSDPDLVRENCYDRLLTPFFERFAPQQIHLAFYEDLKARPAAYLREVLRFIGAPDGPLPPNLESVVNPSAVARAPILALTSRAAATMLRKAGLYRVLMAAKRSTFVRSMVLKSDARPEESADARLADPLRAELLRTFRPGVSWLEERSGRDLRSWKE